MGSTRIDETGCVYGKLIVVKFLEIRKSPNGTKKTIWLCRCVCGRLSEVAGGDLRSPKGTRQCHQCGVTRHGHSPASGPSREYVCYRSMLTRCKRDARYIRKGIRVCPRWRGSEGFPNFLADMGKCPSPTHTVDRIKNDCGYSPDNCRWATQSEQSRNMDLNVWITINGRRMIIEDWLKELGVGAWSYYHRLKQGMTPKQALLTPNQAHAPKSAEHRRKLSEANSTLSEEQKAKANQLRALGLSFPKIGKALGVSASTAARACGKNY